MIAERIDTDSIAGLLVSQWDDSPRLKALIDGLLDLSQRELIDSLAQVERMRRLDLAQGVWLDGIGERMGLRRPATNLENFAFFGFEGSGGVGFDQAPFASAHEAFSPRVPVGDEYYLRLLRMRAEALLADGSVPRLEGAAREVFPGAEYIDHQDMTIAVRNRYEGSVVRDIGNLLDALKAAGGWPTPAGVSLSYFWEYVVGGDCESDDPPAAFDQTPSQVNVGAYEQSDELAQSGDYSWKITVEQDTSATDDASVLVCDNLPYEDLVQLDQITFSAWVYVDSGTSDELQLSDMHIDLDCGDEDEQGNITWDSVTSGNPSAFDRWVELQVTRTLPISDCDIIRLALRIDDRSAAHVIYWDDISFRSEKDA